MGLFIRLVRRSFRLAFWLLPYALRTARVLMLLTVTAVISTVVGIGRSTDIIASTWTKQFLEVVPLIQYEQGIYSVMRFLSAVVIGFGWLVIMATLICVFRML